jgi:pimeloyl-ACP methyl ester carboxylesterase
LAVLLSGGAIEFRPQRAAKTDLKESMSPPPAMPRLRRFQSLGPREFHEIAYAEWGDPYSPRLVFCVHGFNRNGRDFDALAASLADRCHVVCMDAAGRGASEWLTRKSDYNYWQYLSDAAQLLARVTAPLPPPPPLPPAPQKRRRRFFGKAPEAEAHAPSGTVEIQKEISWIGTSMGGLLGMMLAAKPNTPIRRLVLNDVGALVPWSALLRMKGAQKSLNVTFSTFEEVEAHLREVCVDFGPLSDEQWREVARHGAMRQDDGSLALSYDPAIITHMRPGSVPGVDFGSEFLSGIDLWPTYDKISCPTLLLRGSLSDLLLKKTADEMTRRGPKAEVVEFEGMGHAPWLMAEDQIGIVRDFLLGRDENASHEPERDLEPALLVPAYL